VARLPRLVVPGHTHYVIQLGHSQRPVFVDAEDQQAYLLVLREAARAEQVQLHAYAMMANEVQLLATPAQALSLGRLVQAVGRSYVSAYNRRHGGYGTLWAGRFRCAVLQPGVERLNAMLVMDGLPKDAATTSCGQRQGTCPEPWLADPPEFWQLGNTPFEREAAYHRLLTQHPRTADVDRLRLAALGGWAVGSASFVAQLEQQHARPVRPRQRGRPRRLTPGPSQP
jgi:putative transposase